ncbi:hypothetical protein DFH06DRAFT_1333344 [Mycena polygramma]|nr:hypothetical protein DFH06DRAFT_1333344 [Mycena polygramma]
MPDIQEDNSMDETDEEEDFRTYPQRRQRMPTSPPSTPEPRRMQAPAHATFNAPLRTSLDMPVRGSKEAPHVFKGKHTNVQLFVDHYDHLLSKCRVAEEKEKCEFILNYCTIDVQNVIRTMDGFRSRNWAKLRREILKHFDAERALQKYKPADVKKYAMKMRNQPCHNLTQWRKYFVKYNAIAGGPLNRGHLSQEDYFAFFQVGIHRSLRQVLENRILQTNPYRGDEDQYTIKEWNRAAEWYFRRDKYESLMIGAEELGEGLTAFRRPLRSGGVGTHDDFDSDYEEFRRKKKLRAKKKKEDKKRKTTSKKAPVDGERQRYAGNEEEIAGMIRKLNAMRLDDPEYAPVYYKVMVLDQSGTAKQCVKAPIPLRKEYLLRLRIPIISPCQITDRPERPKREKAKGRLAGERDSKAAMDRGIIVYNEDDRKLTMKDGQTIWRRPGESLVKAAVRIAGTGGPRVMLGISEENVDRATAVNYFYQQELQSRVVELESYHAEASSACGSDMEAEEEVYITVPCDEDDPMVQAAERSTSNIRRVRREVFDGVYPPAREHAKPRVVKESASQENREGRSQEKIQTAAPASGPSRTELTGSSRTSLEKPLKNAEDKRVPEITPIEARKVRFEIPEDVEMGDAESKTKKGGRPAGRGENVREETELRQPSGRQSELTATVDKQKVVDRILDTKVELSLREIMVPSKDLHTEIQDLIKVKNVKAVLLGSSMQHPLIANLIWPRTDGILIKVEMETGGQPVCAIVDTGSQLNVVRADIAALAIRRTVDMTQLTNMNDANGGRGQLQGWIKDVEFNCGGAIMETDLWVSRKAPFELLLGRPWQRGNLVSIDERVEGTYLVFKDRLTRRPRYELLAVPYQGAASDFQVEGTSQYQSFMIMQEECSGANFAHRMEATDLDLVVVEKARLLQRTQQEELESFWKYAAILNEAGQTAVGFPNDAQRVTLPNLFEQWKQCFEQDREDFEPAAAMTRFEQRGIKGCEAERVRQHLNSDTAPMNSSANSPQSTTEPESAPPPPPRLPYVSPFSTAPYEHIQYLSRQQFHHPPPNTTIPPPHPNDALSSIESVLHEQWGKYLRREAADVLPAFSAAPQSKYIGCYTRPDGQQIHRSVAMNSLEVLTDERTGRPYSLVGHTVRDTYAVPTSEDTVWPLELFYPTNDRLHEAMVQCLRDPPSDGDSGFPVHARTDCPPLPGFDDPLSARQSNASVARDASDSYAQRFRNDEPHTTPAETASALGLAFDDPSPSPMAASTTESVTTADSMPSLVTIPSPPPIETAMTRLNQDIAARVAQDLVVDDSVCGDRGQREGWGSEDGIGICSVCFEEEHAPWRPCSSAPAQTPPYMIPGHPPTPPRLIPVVLPEEDADDDEKRRQREADRAVQEALRPILEDFVNLPLIEGEALDHIAEHAREMREAFEDLTAALEARRVEGEVAARELVRREARIRASVDQATRDPRPAARGLGLGESETTAVDALRALANCSAHGVSTLAASAHRVPRATVDLSTATPQTEPSLVLAAVQSTPQAPLFIASDSPPSDYSYEEADFYSRYPNQPEVNANGVFSPAVSEWSVSSSDYDVEPERVIDEAISRVRAQQAEARMIANFGSSRNATSTSSVANFPPRPSARPGLDPSKTPSSTGEDRDTAFQHHTAVIAAAATLNTAAASPFPREGEQPRERTAKEQFNELWEWKEEGVRGQDEAFRWEDRANGDPIREALRVLHGPLARYVNYTAMASDSLTTFRNLAPLDLRSRHLYPASASSPDPTHSPTSLDFSLPDDHSEHRAEDGAQQEGDDDDYIVEPLHVGKKREHQPMSPAGAEAEGRKRRRLPTGLADAEVVRKFAEVRESFAYIDQNCDAMHSMVAYQDDFPVGLIRHPFLRDNEAAHMQVLYNVLVYNNRHVLASLLADVLTIQLHDNFTVSQFLNAGYLDSVYPPEHMNRWELLGDTDSDFSDNSSDSSASELGYHSGGEESTHDHTEAAARDVASGSIARDSAQVAAAKDDDYRGFRRMERNGGDPSDYFFVDSRSPGPPGGNGICLN